ncbi:MAG: cytidine deaminase [Mycoplasmoidaceae bacterium]
MEIEKIFNDLSNLLSNSYSPYSNFPVAAIAEGEDGKFYQGVNIENASFGATICAERSAISACISNGNKSVKNIYLLTDADKFIYPCGICLQFISEFLNTDSWVYIFTKNKEYKQYKISELILVPFIKKDLTNE